MNAAKSGVWSLEGRVGQELGVSDWFTIEQRRIDAFADTTMDDQWIHIDVERARRESVFGSTVAHGFLVLSMMPYLRRSIAFLPPDSGQIINYGADYVRFLNPVKAGARVRMRMNLTAFEPRADGRVLLKTRNTVEIEGVETPALVADILTMVVPPAA